VTRDLFVTLPNFEFFTDEFQNLDARVTPGATVGYRFIDLSWLDFILAIGGAHQYTEFDNGRSDNDMAVLFDSDLELDFENGTEWDTQYSLQVIATDFEKTNHHFESEISFDLWDPLDLDITFILDRIEGPQQDDDGQTPKTNDYKLLVGFSIDL